MFDIALSLGTGGYPVGSFSMPHSVSETYYESFKRVNDNGKCYVSIIGKINGAFYPVLGYDALSMRFNNNGQYQRTPTYDLSNSYPMSEYKNVKGIGWGVGSALSYSGFNMEFLPDNDVRKGKLTPGAIIQFWTFETNLEKIVSRLTEANPRPIAGHSAIFDSYLRNEAGEIIGMNYWDARGYHSRTWGEISVRHKYIAGANFTN